MTDPDTDKKAPKAKAGETRPVEEWAKEAGLLPADFAGWHAIMDPKEGHLQPRAARALPRDFWKLRAAMAFRGWSQGAEVTRAEFEKAVDEACNSRIG